MHQRLLLSFALVVGIACSDASAPVPAAAEPAIVYEGFSTTAPDLLRITPGGTPSRVLPPGIRGSDPAVSPDGSRIAFVVADYTASTGDIWLVNADGSGLRRLTTDPELDDAPAWSPDGRHIAFRSYRSLRSGELWTLDVDAGTLVNLTPAAGTAIIDHHRPAWSPDGTRIAFATTEGGDWGIWTMRADGTDRQQLTNTIDFDTEPAWSPDGTRIAFAGQAAPGDRPELYTMRPDGGGVQLVTRDAAWGGGVNPSWRRAER